MFLLFLPLDIFHLFNSWLIDFQMIRKKQQEIKTFFHYVSVNSFRTGSTTEVLIIDTVFTSSMMTIFRGKHNIFFFFFFDCASKTNHLWDKSSITSSFLSYYYYYYYYY